MAENELQILIKGIFSRIKEKYGYTDEQSIIYLKGYEDCAKEHQQSLEKRDKMLRDTVAELCEAKRLLRMALCELNNGTCSKFCSTCTKVNTEKCLDYKTKNYRWIHTAEALKLIGEDDNVHT